MFYDKELRILQNICSIIDNLIRNLAAEWFMFKLHIAFNKTTLPTFIENDKT